MFGDLQKKVMSVLSDNASAILTAGGVVGTVTTAVLTARATFKAAEKIEGEYRSRSMNYQDTQAPPLPRKDKVALVWPLYIPPVLAGSATIGSVVMANRMSAQRAAALAAAYGLSERQLREYKEKVAEKLGPNKEQKMQDELAQESVHRTPGHQNIVIVEGEVLCFDRPTGRYFRSTMEKINKAVNAINAEILAHDYADANFFYQELEMEPTTWTQDVGWMSPDQVELRISTVLTQDDKPCIAIDFVTPPKPDFIRNYTS